jgi:MFS transporter, PHS family, inorganic phosphate transporter
MPRATASVVLPWTRCGGPSSVQFAHSAS